MEELLVSLLLKSLAVLAEAALVQLIRAWWIRLSGTDGIPLLTPAG